MPRIAHRFRVTSIRGQLTLGITAVLVPCLAVGFYSIQQLVRQRVYELTERRLQAEAELISYGLRQWGHGIATTVNALTLSSSFRTGNVQEIQAMLNAKAAADPGRLWRFWSGGQTPILQAYTGDISKQHILEAEHNQASRDYYQAALRGISSYQVVLSKTTGKGCLNISEPVFKNPPTSKSSKLLAADDKLTESTYLSLPLRTDLAGVLVLCVPLSNLGQDTGLFDLFQDQRLSLLAGDYDKNFLNSPDGFGSAVMLVSNTGQLLFPDVEWSGKHIPTIQDIRLSREFPKLYPVAQEAMQQKEVFRHIDTGHHRYFALTSQVDSAWNLILLLNEQKVITVLDAIGQLQAFVGVITVLIAVGIISSRSSSITRPISVAGSALTRISRGDFDLHIQATANDEIGGLLRNIQGAADRLKLFLQESTAFAVTQKQIDTAKSIQADFLLSQLPSSSCYEVEAFSRPALEIGADWYDMVDVGDYVVLVVADVCDKGVPSALYMSVFRSLIRSKLLERVNALGDFSSSSSLSPDETDSHAATSIRDAISQTNDYMADNQNSSMMFATVFIAAVNTTTGSVSYVCAGHEAPVLVEGNRLRMFDSVAGPAIGLFGGVIYSVSRTQMQPGDSLVIYSDGLVDARNPADEGWGLARLQELLQHAQSRSASTLMATITTAVDRHMSDADQFDDLTVMVFKWKGNSLGVS